MSRKLVNVGEIGELLSVKPATVYKWVQQGKIPSYKINGLVRFNPDEVWNWALKRKAQKRHVQNLQTGPELVP